MNCVSPNILDQWIAFELIEAEAGVPKKTDSSPEAALAQIHSMGL